MIISPGYAIMVHAILSTAHIPRKFKECLNGATSIVAWAENIKKEIVVLGRTV
jgi:hypothetical protein